MTRKLLFDIVTIGAYVLPVCLAVGVTALPRPKSSLLRSAIGMLVAWVASVGCSWVGFYRHLQSPHPLSRGDFGYENSRGIANRPSSITAMRGPSH